MLKGHDDTEARNQLRNQINRNGGEEQILAVQMNLLVCQQSCLRATQRVDDVPQLQFWMPAIAGDLHNPFVSVSCLLVIQVCA